MVDAAHDEREIAEAIREQVEHGPFERDELFGDGTAGRRIAEILAIARPAIQKRLSYELENLPAGLG
jgi:hypothetical protein